MFYHLAFCAVNFILFQFPNDKPVKYENPMSTKGSDRC